MFIILKIRWWNIIIYTQPKASNVKYDMPLIMMEMTILQNFLF